MEVLLLCVTLIYFACCVRDYMKPFPESLKDLRFNELLVRNYTMFELKKYKGVIFHYTKK